MHLTRNRAVVGTIGAAVVLLGLAPVPALAHSVFTVTFTNVSKQIMAPVVVAVHMDNPGLYFELGEPASEALAALAEDGDGSALQAAVAATPGVTDVAMIRGAGGVIMPGETAVVELPAHGYAQFVSLAGMLVTTNDAFVAIRNLHMPDYGTVFADALAYDAGSERNTESCDHIPGPPCDNAGVRMTDGAEGFVHVHPGISGEGDVPAISYDWRNPVARISVQGPLPGFAGESTQLHRP